MDKVNWAVMYHLKMMHFASFPKKYAIIACVPITLFFVAAFFQFDAFFATKSNQYLATSDTLPNSKEISHEFAIFKNCEGDFGRAAVGPAGQTCDQILANSEFQQFYYELNTQTADGTFSLFNYLGGGVDDTEYFIIEVDAFDEKRRAISLKFHQLRTSQGYHLTKYSHVWNLTYDNEGIPVFSFIPVKPNIHQSAPVDAKTTPNQNIGYSFSLVEGAFVDRDTKNMGKSSLYVPFENTISEHPVYWNEVIGTGSTKTYLGFIEGCEGQSICGFASFEKYTYPNAVYLGAVKNFEKDQTHEAIPLSDGSLSQFSPSQCGLNCSSAYLSWFGEGGEVFFRVGSQANGSEIVSELTRAANSFIIYNSEE